MDINYKVETNKDFVTAVEDLKASLTKYKFSVLWELNFKDKLKEKGLEFDQNFKILEVCNPGEAKKVLEKNIEVGYFLPCKMVVYENQDSVFIGMPKPSGFIGAMADDELAQIATEVEKELMSAIDDAKQ